MPQPVVDVLESVEIEQEQCELLVLPFCPDKGLIQPVQQQRTIGQAGKLVVIRRVAYVCDLVLAPNGKLAEPCIDFREEDDLLLRGDRFLLTRRQRPLELFHPCEDVLQSLGSGIDGTILHGRAQVHGVAIRRNPDVRSADHTCRLQPICPHGDAGRLGRVARNPHDGAQDEPGERISSVRCRT